MIKQTIFFLSINNLTYSEEQILFMFNKYNIVLRHKAEFSNYYRIYIDVTIDRKEEYNILKIFEDNNIDDHRYFFYTELYFDENDKIINRDNIQKIEITEESLNSELSRKTPRFIPWENI
jgi:hypothetical protein